MRYVMALVLAIGLPGSAGAQQGLLNALDRQDLQRTLQQSQMRREIERREQDLQRQQDQVRIQQQIDRQPILRPQPFPCPSAGPPTLC